MRRALLGVAALAALAPAPAAAQTVAGLALDLPSHGRGAHAAQARPHANSLNYSGGPVLHSNRTHVIFWQPSGSGLSFESGYTELVQRFLVNVAADSHHTSNPYALTGQYSDPAGPAVYDSSFAGSVPVDDPLPTSGCVEPPVTGPGWTVCLTDDQLSHEIQHVVQSRHLPTTSRDMYFLVMPKGLGDCIDSTSTSCALGGQVGGYCGYHTATAAGTILYAVIPYNAVPGHCQSDNPRPNGNPADPTLSTLSHEHNEIITDPTDNSWIDSSGNENGDLCITNFGPNLGGSGASAYNQSINGGHYYLQDEWSNANGGCQPRAAPNTARFSFKRARAARSLMLTGRASAPGRQIVAYQWSFGDGRTGTSRQLTHRFARPGSYKVVLRAVDSWGNWGLYARTIRVSAAGR
jgi:hypothetical protein